MSTIRLGSKQRYEVGNPLAELTGIGQGFNSFGRRRGRDHNTYPTSGSVGGARATRGAAPPAPAP